MVTAVRFLNGQKPFLLTTAAQNIPVFLRKSLLHKKHFFGWLKTANFSIVCGTVTLKSPLSRESDAPHVHQRPRKHPPRCTLDCGFKTSESPALRGFVGERGRFATTSLYLVLKSNGLHRSKNPPVKFGFSPKIVPANIAKKLLPQRCFKPLLIPIFNFPHKRPTFVFAGESGYTLGFRRRIAHSGLHAETGVFPPSVTAQSCAASKIALNTAFVTLDSAALLYTYISRFSVNPTISNSSISDHLSSRFSTSCTNGPRSLSQTKAGTHSPFGERSHTAAYTAKQGLFQMGVVSLPSERSARFGNPAWPGGRTANFAAFGPWSGMLSKNAEGLRNSDAPMRVAVPRRRGPAGLRDPVVRPLMLRFSVSVRKVSAQFPANATRSPSHPKPSTHPAQFKESHTSAYTLKRVCP